MIVGYMLVGFACGEHVTGMLLPETIDAKRPFSVASIVSNITLAFIAFSAGSELYLPKLGRQRLREIGVQILLMGVLMLAIGTPIILASESLLNGTLAASRPA